MMDRYDPRDARDPRLFRQAIDQARTRYVPGLVLAEVDYFLRERAMEVDRRLPTSVWASWTHRS